MFDFISVCPDESRMLVSLVALPMLHERRLSLWLCTLNSWVSPQECTARQYAHAIRAGTEGSLLSSAYLMID
jgi:hypothetical protein